MGRHPYSGCQTAATSGIRSRGAPLANVRKERGLEPAPERTTRTTGRECLAAHWDVLAAADCFTVEVWTPRGLTRFTVLGLMPPGQPPRVRSRASAPSPTGRGAPSSCGTPPMPRTDSCDTSGVLIHDRDPLFRPAGRDPLPPADVTPIRRPARAPTLNASTERFVRTIKDSCLERMVLIGEGSRRRAVRECVAHDHHERNHQGLDHRLTLPLSTAPPPRGRVQCRQRLGGMLHDYYRAAA